MERFLSPGTAAPRGGTVERVPERATRTDLTFPAHYRAEQGEIRALWGPQRENMPLCATLPFWAL